MANPLHHIEKYPELTKKILGIEYQQWLGLIEVAKIEEKRILLAQEQKKRFGLIKKEEEDRSNSSKEEEICLCIFKTLIRISSVRNAV